MSLAPITPNSIKKLATVPGDRPVFFISFSPSQPFSLTVKAELHKDHGEISIKWGSKMMKNVNSSKVNTKIMTPSEITEFKRAARLVLTSGDSSTTRKLAALDNNVTWVKMPFIKNLSEGEIAKWDTTSGQYVGQPEKVKMMLQRFADSKTWHQLGKVIAVDLFAGNADRFDDYGWANEGNVMFQKRLGGYKVIGLDTFEAQGINSNLTDGNNVGNVAKLKSRESRTAYATLIVTDIEKHIGRAIGQGTFKFKSGIFTSIELTKDSRGFLGLYVDDLEKGMKEGAEELKKYLLGKRKQYSKHSASDLIPLGILKRMKELDWI